MVTPYVTALTAGIILIMQIALAFMVSGARGTNKISLGETGNAAMFKAVRRHGNLAENAGLFIAGFALLEISKFAPLMLHILCLAFVISRILHAIGMSQVKTSNIFRLLGGLGTYVIGLVLGLLLIWAGFIAAMAAHHIGG